MVSIVKHIKLILLLLFLSNALNTRGQEIYVDISCTNQYPGVGEKIKLSYVLKMKLTGGSAAVSHNGIKIEKPDMQSLNVIDEGTEGSTFSFGGFGGDGDMQISKYSFILQPTKEGDVKLAPFSFVMNGETHTSEAYTFHVGEGEPDAQIVKKNAGYFIRMEVSKKDLYLGEHTLITYTLYSRSSNISVQDYDFPMTNGFWKEEITPGNNGFGQEQVNIQGYQYLKIPLKKEIVYAQKTGDITLEPYNLDLLVGGGFFSQGSLESLESNSPVISVKSLPEGAPFGFDNQVGKNYELDMSYSSTALKAGEPIDVKIKITGKGNLKQLDAPDLTFPTDFDTYEPETTDKVKLSTSGLSGYKEFNYLVIPRHHGTFEIPAFEFSYFDISSSSYQTLSYPAQTIEVEKSATSTPATITSGNVADNKEEVEVLNTEIRHIVYTTSLRTTSTTFFRSPLFWTGLTVPLVLVLGGFFFVAIKPKEKKVDLKKSAGKHVFKVLKLAEQKLSSNDNIGFYEELYKGMMNYLSEKLETPPSELTKESIAVKLDSKELSNPVLSVIEECEMARFTPVTNAGAKETMNKVRSIIQNIENHVN